MSGVFLDNNRCQNLHAYLSQYILFPIEDCQLEVDTDLENALRAFDRLLTGQHTQEDINCIVNYEAMLEEKRAEESAAQKSQVPYLPATAPVRFMSGKINHQQTRKTDDVGCDASYPQMPRFHHCNTVIDRS